MIIHFIFAALVVTALLLIICSAQIDRIVRRLNQLDAMLANYSLVLEHTRELAEFLSDKSEERDEEMEHLSGECSDMQRAIEVLIKSCEERSMECDELRERLDELPIEEFIETQKQENAFMQGMQNIFNYGGDVQRLNVEGLKHE